MDFLLNFIIVICLIATFLTLLIGLFHTAKSGDSENNKIIGAHMVGTDAGEQIQGIAIAIQSGATKEDFDQTIGIHPTSAEEWVTMREERTC